MDKKFATPILFIIFNRPDTTIKVFESIKKVKPPRLYVAADGPRSHKIGENELCEATRRVIDGIDWPCEVFTKFSPINLGMKDAESQAMNWFFENEEKGIVLEDDTLPDISFYTFCQEMLNYYENDTRVMHISGCNFQFGKVWGDGSYYYSRHPTCWGWASWKRAWKYYDVNLNKLEKFIQLGHQHDIMVGDKEKSSYLKILRKIKEKGITWDYQWSFAVFSQNGLAVTPNVNLVKNLGFGENSTTAFYTGSKLASLEVGEIKEIKHPSFMLENIRADRYFNHVTFNQVPLILRIWNKLKKEIKKH